MGTTLTGTTPQDTYDSLIKVTDNGPLSGTAKYLSDGLGNDSALALSTTAVGVGTATPASALHVLGTQFRIEANDPTITLKRNVAAAFGGHIDWLTNDNTIGFQIANNTLISAAFLEFNHSGINRMVIKSDGNVGIGTSNPYSKVTIHSTASSTLGLNSQTGLVLGQGGSANDIVQIGFNQAVQSTYSPASIGYAITNASASTYGDLVFGTRSVTSDTAPTERMRILSSGGITFNGDTAAANALDDYEEGTWTMGLSFADSDTGITYSTRGATYTKIGRQVTINGYLALSNKGSATGAAKITGLPFTIPNNVANYSPASVWLYQVTFANQHQSYGIVNSTTIAFNEITEAGVVTGLTDANFANNSEFMISLTYFV